MLGVSENAGSRPLTFCRTLFVSCSRNRVSNYLEVQSLGTFLPLYAGNLYIITAAGACSAEMFAEEIIKDTLNLESIKAA